MANAKIRHESVIAGVTLELNAAEADYVRCVVGRASGGEIEGSQIYNALYGLVPEVFVAEGASLRVNRR